MIYPLPKSHYTKDYALSEQERKPKEFASNLLGTSAVAGTARAAVKIRLAQAIKSDPGVLRAQELAKSNSARTNAENAEAIESLRISCLEKVFAVEESNRNRIIRAEAKAHQARLLEVVYTDAIILITQPGEHPLDVITLDCGIKLDPRVLHERKVRANIGCEIRRTITPPDCDADPLTDSDADSDADSNADSNADSKDISDSISNDVSGGFKSKKN